MELDKNKMIIIVISIALILTCAYMGYDYHEEQIDNAYRVGVQDGAHYERMNIVQQLSTTGAYALQVTQNNETGVVYLGIIQNDGIQG